MQINTVKWPQSLFSFPSLVRSCGLKEKTGCSFKESSYKACPASFSVWAFRASPYELLESGRVGWAWGRGAKERKHMLPLPWALRWQSSWFHQLPGQEMPSGPKTMDEPSCQDLIFILPTQLFHLIVNLLKSSYIWANPGELVARQATPECPAPLVHIPLTSFFLSPAASCPSKFHYLRDFPAEVPFSQTTLFFLATFFLNI